MRALLVAALALIATSAGAVLIPVYDDTRVVASCAYLDGGPDGAAWATLGVADIRNPVAGQSFRVTGSMCGFDYDIAMTIDRATHSITFERTMIDAVGYNPDELHFVGGWFRVSFASTEPIDFWDGTQWLEDQDGFTVAYYVQYMSPSFTDRPDLHSRPYESLTVYWTPEPGTLALVGLGLATVAQRRRS